MIHEQNESTIYQSQQINAAANVPPYKAANKQAEGYEIISYLYPNDAHIIPSLTALGGMANAMSQFLSSTAAITYTGNEDWSLAQVGTLSQTLMYGPPNMGSCDCSFKSTALIPPILSKPIVRTRQRMRPLLAALSSQARTRPTAP